jgi:predicted carbohydrate-binding protein with CBM5 and CBM33 domain
MIGSRKKMLGVKLIILLAGVNAVFGHGYFVRPESRISQCNKGQSRTPGLWWPTDGSGMPDQGCREAFQQTQHHSSFTNRMAYRFRFAGADRRRLETGGFMPLDQVCSVGNRFPAADVRTNWTRTPITVGINNNQAVIDFEFCATAPHNPARWFFYHHEHDVKDRPIRWDTLRYIGELGDTPLIHSPTTVPNCFIHDDPHNGVYRFRYQLPVARRGTYVVVWYSGEFFQSGGYVQCIDYERKVSPRASGSEPSPHPEPYDYVGEEERFNYGEVPSQFQDV